MMEVVNIKKFLIGLLLINILLGNSIILGVESFNTKDIVENIPSNINLDGFLEEIKTYSNEYFPELADEKFFQELVNGNISNNSTNIIEKIINVFIGEFQNNLALILKILGVAVLCSVLKNIQTNFSDTGIGEIAFYACYLIIVGLIITSFTNVVSLCAETVGKLSSFMNTIVPLVFALIAATGNIASISFMQPLIIGMVTLIGHLMNKIVIPIIYVSTVINIITNISSYIKLDKLSEMFKKSSLWIMEICMLIFTGILSLEGSLAASVDGMTGKIAKNLISSTIPVVGKILGDTVDSVIGGISITKNAIGIIGVVVILAITISPLIKSLISMLVFNISITLMEPVADERITKCMNGVASSLKIIVGILAVVVFIFIIAITMMLKISNSALMYK